VPGPPLGLLPALVHRNERSVGGLASRERGGLVDGRADQRMPKRQRRVHHLDQPDLLGRLQRLLVHGQHPPGGQDRGQLAGVLGRGDQQQRLGRLGQPPHALQEHLRQPGAQRQPLR